MRPICHLNGELLPIAEARIDPLDRGWMFGDALYEVIKVREGILLHLEPHLQRLRQGLTRAEIPEPRRLESRCRELLGACEIEAGYLYLQISRGAGPRRHLPPPDLSPTVLILPCEHRFDPPAGRTMRAVTVPDWRWQFRHLKTTSLMATALGKLEARRAGADEVLFVGPEGELREGGSTNVFVRQEDRWRTHPLDDAILEGVTRGILCRLAPGLAMPVVERAPRLSDRDRWQEAFVCGTITGVQPLVELDGRPLGGGEWTRRLAVAYEDFERQALAAAAR